jgi:hypothetical protein
VFLSPEQRTELRLWLEGGFIPQFQAVAYVPLTGYDYPGCSRRSRLERTMKPLRVEFDMTRADLAAAADVAVDRDPGAAAARHKIQRKMVVLIVALIAVQASAFIVAGPLLDPGTVVLCVVMNLWLVWMIPTRRSMQRAVRRHVAARFATPAGRAYLGPRSVEASRDGLAISSDFGSSLTTWRGVIDLIPTRDHLFVVLPGPTYLCVPRRAFDSDAEFDRFGETVAELAAAGGGLIGQDR